jgi:penicillin-binding protein 2
MTDKFFNRHIIIKIIVIVVASILVMRLFKLQVIDDYEAIADNQSIYRQVIYPARGALLDRKGKMILNNTIKYNLCFTPKKVDKLMDTTRLCKILGITDSTFKETYRRALLKEQNLNRSIPVFKELGEEIVAGLHEFVDNYTGLELQPHTVRNSPYSCGGLIIGYTGEVSNEMLKKERYASYAKGDYVGITGLENKYEEFLRGVRGIKHLKRDNFNRIIGSYKNGKLDTIAKKGEDLELFLDIELEQYAEKLLANKLGSLVAIDPKTGGILAMVSTPSFDPNIVNASDRSSKMGAMLLDATKPLYNRAVLAEYPPGSTFKPLTAMVALDEGVITPSFGLGCGGSYHACGSKIGCTHSGGGHAAHLGNAMANSCNSYFCHLFRLAVDNPAIGDKRKGLAKWKEYMNNFGFGKPIGVDLPNERGGYIPGPEWYDKTYNNNWNSCNNCMNGMGQGEVTATPLQMANSLCIIANKGYYYTPHFVKSIGGDAKHPAIKKYLNKHTPVHIPPEMYYAVHAGMEKVVAEGTGKIAKIPNIKVCAKTGTVENYAVVNGKRVKLVNHSMFVAFAPMEDPKIVVAVAVENSGYGATWAGPIASLIIQKYLTDTIPKNRKAVETKMFKSKVIPSYIYILDSLQKQKDRAIQARKLFVTDSIKRFNHLRDSLLKAKPTTQIKQPIKSFKQLFAYIPKRNEYISH